MDGSLAILRSFLQYFSQSGRWDKYNERFCAMVSRVRLKRFSHTAGLEAEAARSVGQR